VPAWLDDLLRMRRGTGTADLPVFSDVLGGYRDMSNVERDFREVRTGTPFAWVVPHTYRKGVATWLDDKGFSARVIADQLGHARISMTQDVYMGLRVVDLSAANSLEDLMQSPEPPRPESENE
jgi:integrase